jgi:hypothetical protein
MNDYKALQAELIAVSVSPPEMAARYERIFPIDFAYLCDPQFATRRLYGLARNQALVFRSFAMFGFQETKERTFEDFQSEQKEVSTKAGIELLEGDPFNPVKETAEIEADMAGELDGFFVIDREGCVRLANTGFGFNLLPAKEELLGLLTNLNAR